MNNTFRASEQLPPVGIYHAFYNGDHVIFQVHDGGFRVINYHGERNDSPQLNLIKWMPDEHQLRPVSQWVAVPVSSPKAELVEGFYYDAAKNTFQLIKVSKQPVSQSAGVWQGKIKELACDFMWENNKPSINDGYQSVRKLYDEWLSQNNYHKNKLDESTVSQPQPQVDELKLERCYKDMVYQRNIENPYSTGSPSYTGYEKGFEDCWKIFFNGDQNEAKDPHETSNVKCNLCGKEWVAVRPEGLEKLECPKCGNITHFENL